MKLTKPFLALVLLSAASTARGQAKGDGVVPVGSAGVARLGLGYNSSTGQFLSPCVKGRQEGVGYGVVARGGKAVTDIDVYTSVRERLRDFGLTAGMAFSGFLSSVSARARVATTSATSERTTHVQASVTVVRADSVLDRLEWTDEARAASPEAFRGMCGDSYVSALVIGGLFTASASLTASTSTERQQIEAEMKAKVGSFKGMVEALSRVSEERRDVATALRVARDGAENDPTPTTPDDIVSYAATFASRLSGQEALIGVRVVPYPAGLPNRTQPTPPFSSRASLFDLLLQRRDSLTKLRAHYERALETSDGISNSADVEAALSVVTSSLDTLFSIAERCLPAEPAAVCTLTQARQQVRIPSTRVLFRPWSFSLGSRAEGACQAHVYSASAVEVNGDATAWYPLASDSTAFVASTNESFSGFNQLHCQLTLPARRAAVLVEVDTLVIYSKSQQPGTARPASTTLSVDVYAARIERSEFERRAAPSSAAQSKRVFSHVMEVPAGAPRNERFRKCIEIGEPTNKLDLTVTLIDGTREWALDARARGIRLIGGCPGAAED